MHSSLLRRRAASTWLKETGRPPATSLIACQTTARCSASGAAVKPATSISSTGSGAWAAPRRPTPGATGAATTATQERAHDATVARIHAGQPARSGTAKETEQKRLGLIVTRMAERHQIGAGRDARALEELVPRGAAGILDRAPLAARARGHIGAI